MKSFLSRCVLIVAAGGVASLLFAWGIQIMRPYVGVAVWESSLAATVLFGCMLNVALAAGWLLRRDAIASCLGALAIIGTLSAAVDQLVPDAGMASLVAALMAWLAVMASGWRPGRKGLPQEAYCPTFLETVVWATLYTSGLGTAWIIVSAPTYAEGFALLTWLLLGAFVLLNGLTCLVVVRVQLRPGPVCRLGTGAALSVPAAVLVGAAALFYMIRVEGEPKLPVPPAAAWAGAFKSLGPVPSVVAETHEVAHQRFDKDQLIALLASEGRLPVAHLATLFLLTGDEQWAQTFKARVLDEARSNYLTGATGSIKYGQRFAMIRAMFTNELRRKDPDLFSAQDLRVLSDWYRTIVERIFTPEWVDYLYAIPFQEPPEGPYLNQEIGVGALAALAPVVRLHHPDIARRIDEYLARAAVVFRRNFRNQDDSLAYQTVWLENAWVAARYASADNDDWSRGLEAAVTWAMLQLPESASPLNYGLPGDHRPLGVLSLGAFALRNGRAKRLLEAHLAAMATAGDALHPEEILLWLWDDEPVAPYERATSSLIRGPTGYSFRPGPMEVDKAVLRETTPGRDELFVLLGLRNQGWHRYPATNTVIRMSVGPHTLVAEDVIVKYHGWLPSGRAKHRDKKVDRARLSGLLVARSGIDALVGRISGVYSRWRQDAPRLAELRLAGRLDGVQIVQVGSGDWAKVDHVRTYVVADGHSVIVLDQILNPQVHDVAVRWQLSGFSDGGPSRLVRVLDPHRVMALETQSTAGSSTEWREVDSNEVRASSSAPVSHVLTTTSRDPDSAVASTFHIEPATSAEGGRVRVRELSAAFAVVDIELLEPERLLTVIVRPFGDDESVEVSIAPVDGGSKSVSQIRRGDGV